MESDSTTPPQPVILKTIAIQREKASFSTAVQAAIASRMRSVLRKLRLAQAASIPVIVAIVLVLAAFVTLRRAGTEPAAAATLPPVVFEAKTLVGASGVQRERDARLVLADGMLTVSCTDEAHDVLHSVPYDGVTSIDYSRGRDPMWNSPDGPARVARASSVLGRWGIFVERYWISLRTEIDDEFVVLRVSDEQVRNVLNALEERTGRTPQIVGARRGNN